MKHRVEPGRLSGTVRILAIDYGRVRVGMAVAHETAGIPRPLPVVHLDTGFWAMLRDVVSQWEVGRIVVGLPLIKGGEEGEMAVEAREFAQRVQRETQLPVELWDEGLTTWEAKGVLRGRGVSERRQKGKRDSVAAALLLERYLKTRVGR